jgi:hypothetical protein
VPLQIPRHRLGPQIGYIFPVAGMQGYVNLKGYGEFDHDNRPDGWNVWLTFVLSPATAFHCVFVVDGDESPTSRLK